MCFSPGCPVADCTDPTNPTTATHKRKDTCKIDPLMAKFTLLRYICAPAHNHARHPSRVPQAPFHDAHCPVRGKIPSDNPRTTTSTHHCLRSPEATEPLLPKHESYDGPGICQIVSFVALRTVSAANNAIRAFTSSSGVERNRNNNSACRVCCCVLPDVLGLCDDGLRRTGVATILGSPARRRLYRGRDAARCLCRYGCRPLPVFFAVAADASG